MSKTHAQQIALWRPDQQRFEFVRRTGPQNRRPHEGHEDYGDGGFSGKVAIVHRYGRYRGVPVIFRLPDHVQRFVRTCQAISSIAELPCSPGELEEAMLEIVRRNKQPYIRCSVHGGGGTRVYAPGEPPLLHIRTEDINPLASNYLGRSVSNRGLRVLVTDKYRRGFPGNPLTLAKASQNYPSSINAKTEAKQKGYDEAALPTWDGLAVSELSVANLVVIIGREAFTPDDQSGALDSITRRTAEELLKFRFNIVTKRHRIKLTPEVLKAADEMFGCGTAIGICRITEFAWPARNIAWRLKSSRRQIVPELNRDYRGLLMGKTILPGTEMIGRQYYTPVFDTVRQQLGWEQGLY